MFNGLTGKLHRDHNTAPCESASSRLYTARTVSSCWLLQAHNWLGRTPSPLQNRQSRVRGKRNPEFWEKNRDLTFFHRFVLNACPFNLSSGDQRADGDVPARSLSQTGVTGLFPTKVVKAKLGALLRHSHSIVTRLLIWNQFIRAAEWGEILSYSHQDL